MEKVLVKNISGRILYAGSLASSGDIEIVSVGLKSIVGRKFAIYGVGFRGNNIKIISDLLEANTYVRAAGYNLKDGEEWGIFHVVERDDEVVFDYDTPENPWYMRLFRDTNFRKVNFWDFAGHWWSELDPGERLRINRDIIIEGTVYLWKFRIGKFYMVGI